MSNRLKNIVSRIKSWNLQRKITSGTASRGRTCLVNEKIKFRYRLRSRWEELKLRFRVFFAAAEALVSGGTNGTITPTGRLYAIKFKRDSENKEIPGTRENLGLVSTKVVTTAGVGYIVDAFQNSVELENMKFHASGTGGTAEAVGDTALVTEVETRATGTTAEGASANIYQTVGTVAYTATRAIVEHGVLSASSGGVLLDRSVFTAINVVNGDSIEFTYELTLPAGS